MVPAYPCQRLALLALLGLVIALPARAERIQDLVGLGGAPENHLVGYGIVVGLQGTGDQTTQVPYTKQSVINMLRHMGVNIPAGAFLQPNDVASVMVTARVPPFVSQGQHVDVTVSAIGNAKSLNGGILLDTPLRGGNGKVYADAQGAVLVSGYQASASGSSSRVNSTTVGHIPGGAIMARSIQASFAQGGQTRLLLDHPDFTTAARIAHRINREFGPGVAQAVNPGLVRVRDRGSSRVDFMARLLALQVRPGRQTPTVVIDAQSGTIVMGAGVQLGPAVVSHGDLSVQITTRNGVSQPAPLSRGRTTRVRNSSVRASQQKAHVIRFPRATTLGAVARALNAVGATPSDLVAIVQALKQAGALHGKLEVM